MNKAFALTLALFVLGACENKNKKEVQGTAEKAGSGSDSTGGPVADASGLWSVAPGNAIFGLVFADGVLERGFATANELKRIVASVPKGAELVTMMETEVASSGAPFNLLDGKAYAEHGIDLSKGAAFFVDKDEKFVAVLPVGDREAFKKLVKATTENVDGVDYDRIDEAYCTVREERYLCSESRELLTAKPGALTERRKALPESLQGDIELVALLDQIPDAQEGLADLAPAITGVKTGVLSARLGGGRLVVRGWLEGTPPAPVATGLAAIPFDDGLRKLGGGATSVYSMRAPLEATGLLRQMPPAMPIGSFDFRTGVVDQLTGELAGYFVSADSPLGVGYVLGIGMKDTSAFGAALPDLCKMGAGATGIGFTAGERSCKGTFDPKMVPDPSLQQILTAPIPVSLEVRDKMAIIAVGAEPSEGLAAAQAGGNASKSMLGDPWNAVIWGRWADPFGGKGGIATQLFKQAASQVPPDMLGFVALSRVVMAHLFETGFAFKLDDKGAHLLMELTTMAADPDETYMAYSKLVADALTQGRPYFDELAALAQKHPDSLVAKQSAMAQSGAPSLAFFTGVGAAVAIPAFLKYTKKAKASEATWLLRRMADGARAYHAEKGKLPPSAKMTPPAGACCPGKCAPSAEAWSDPSWTNLQFAVEDPHYFSYEFKSKGSRFEAIAVGDLDCDGVFSTYTLDGQLKGKEVELGFIRQENELE